MQSIKFETINNKRIFTIFSEPDSTKKKIVIMSHGFRGNTTGPARSFVDFERLLLKNGFSVLRFDQPCSGNSEGSFLDSSFSQWVKTITFFAKKYLELDYQVVLMGQSMGATAVMVAAGQSHLKNKIPCIIIWVPDPKSKVNVKPEKIYEEGGQKYKGKFWLEARGSNFFKALSAYPGGIHLVYGEKDRYISEKLRKQVIKKVKAKNQTVSVLSKQDHNPWDYETLQHVSQKEVRFLAKFIK